MSHAADQPPVRADVCLLLEGTYPYVRGGVSTWVHQIITALPELNFAIAYIGAEKATTGESRYELPANVVALTHTYLFDDANLNGVNADASAQANSGANQRLRESVKTFFLNTDNERDTGPLLKALSDAAQRSTSGFDTFWEHPDTWEIIRSYYLEHFSDQSFIEVYWSLRFMIRPLWRIAATLTELPSAEVYHSVCTGYAGLLGAMAARQNGASFLLSEHGIYVRERISELLRADWSSSTPRSNSSGAFSLPPLLGNAVNPLRKLWIDKFIELGRLSYDTADHIVSLFQKNADHQVEFGADAARISIIPNGVAVDQFDSLRDQRQAARRMHAERMNVGFLGRIVEIKDVKTLLRAAAIVSDKLPQAKFLVMGPFDEDLEYAEECRQLTHQLGIESNVEFPGSKTLDQALPPTDLMVLSSVSEGLPFVALEAFAAGIPLVATDVGSCRELVEGRSGETPVLGPAGAIVPVGDPDALAAAIVRILADRELQEQLGDAGRLRVEQTYAEPEVIGAYRQLYQLLGEKHSQRTSLQNTEY